MPRVNRITKSLTAHKCGKCGADIPKGSAYLWWKFRFGGKYIRCSKPECAPKGSDLTQSEYLGAAADFEDSFNSAEDLDVLREIADEIRNLGQEQEDKRSNMPDSLQESDTGNLLQERAEACENTASEIESACDDAESEIDGWEFKVEDLSEEDRKQYEPLSEEEKKEEQERFKEEFTEEKIQEAKDNVSLDFGS